MAGTVIEAQGLVKKYGDLVAVAGIDLEVQPGEIFGFLGPNGAGKSTTISMLCTLLTPTAGVDRIQRFTSPATARSTTRRPPTALPIALRARP